MMYRAYQLQYDTLEPWRKLARVGVAGSQFVKAMKPRGLAHSVSALLDVAARAKLTHTRPAYGIAEALVGKEKVPVREEVVLSLPFGNLLRFARDGVPEQPKVLVVAPLSGHFATLLRNTVSTLLADHDVYITDWKNARDVPLADGKFGFAEYVEYVIRFLERLGPDSHVVAVCQPCVHALAAVALMADDRNPAIPASITLMAGPIDTRINPTVVNDLATTRRIEWFERNLISHVPFRFGGAGRRVYPGFVQLAAFMSMNRAKHTASFQRLYQHLADGRIAEAEAIATFYDEYFAVLDLTAEFYLETVQMVFQQQRLAKGELVLNNRKVEPRALRRTALLTIEGAKDDICSIGQTAAAHTLCSSLRPHLKHHHLQAGVGHYGTFSGKRWQTRIYPVIRNQVLAMS